MLGALLGVGEIAEIAAMSRGRWSAGTRWQAGVSAVGTLVLCGLVASRPRLTAGGSHPH